MPGGPEPSPLPHSPAAEGLQQGRRLPSWSPKCLSCLLALHVRQKQDGLLVRTPITKGKSQGNLWISSLLLFGHPSESEIPLVWDSWVDQGCGRGSWPSLLWVQGHILGGRWVEWWEHLGHHALLFCVLSLCY